MQSSDGVWRERGLRSAVLAGDERAWQTLYDESFAGLRTYVAWRCGGLGDLIDEAVQETWLAAVRRIRSFDPGAGTFAGWLRGVAANVIRNLVRRRRTRAAHSLNGRTVTLPTMGDALQQQDRAERIARALTSLPEHYEEVLRAKYLDQRSVAEIARARHESPKAVESLLTRARQAFRDIYDGAS